MKRRFPKTIKEMQQEAKIGQREERKFWLKQSIKDRCVCETIRMAWRIAVEPIESFSFRRMVEE